MLAKTIQSGLTEIDCIVRGQAYKIKEDKFNYLGVVVELPKINLAIYHYYPNGDFGLPDKNRCVREKFIAVVIEGEYTPMNYHKAYFLLQEIYLNKIKK